MKKLKLLQILFGTLLFLCTSCEEPFPELPEETQNGAHTFGCLVNNELVFMRDSWSYGVGYARATYNTIHDRLEITATCQFDQQFVLCVNHPQQGVESELSEISYLLPNSTTEMKAANTGRIHLTRVDTSGWYDGIVSGTFSFELQGPAGKIIRVTKGRFDLGLGIINYQY